MRNTKYAYDPVDKVPVFIGNREDWTYRQNYRWYGPTRENPEIAEHQRWGRQYNCCHDPSCASPVEAAQGPEQAWNFRRFRTDRRKPSSCKHHSKYSGESSFHWKTAFNIEKVLERKKRQGEQWLGKDIAFVQREQDRFFPLGEEGAHLRPDVFVMFTDGDWLAIEIVYTHRPEMKHHEAYAPLANGDAAFGPRVVVIDLNDELPLINDETHRLWVREGGIEDALAREAAESSRMGRFEERRTHFDSRSAAQRLRSRNRFITQIEREFPDFTWSQVPPIDATLKETEQAFVEQLREQLKRSALQREFEACVQAHGGRDYGLVPESFANSDTMKQAFEASLEKMNRRHQGIMALNERFTFLNIPREFMDERPEHFHDWLSKMEASAAKCQSALQEERLRATEAGCDEVQVDVLDGFILDHESKDVHDYKKRLEAHVDETIHANHLKAVEAKVGEFKEATGIDVANHAYGFSCQDLAETFLELGQLTTWLNGVETYLQAVDAATTEVLRDWDIDVGLQEEFRAKIRSEADLVKYDDLAGVSLFVKQSITEGMLKHLESNIRSNLGIAVPSSVRDHVRRDPHALRSWMDRAVEYQGQCESLRQSAIRVAQLERKSALCISKLEREKVTYDFALNANSFNSTLNRILEQFGNTGQSRGRQSSTRSTRNRTRSNQTRTSGLRTQVRTQTEAEPSAVERVKAEIADLENKKISQIGVLKDPKRTKRAKKGAKKHLDRIKQEIRQARTKLDRLEAEEARSLHSDRVRNALKHLSNTGDVRGVLNANNVRPAPYNKHLNGKLGHEIKSAEKKQKPSERLQDIQSRSEETKKRANQLRNNAGGE